jgi:multidrug resistance protein, MATE family
MNSPDHPFVRHPHRTLLKLSVPVLLSMTAEPLTALVDTAFISSLGVSSLAALGVGTAALSSLFWIFNFLGIATQTEVAKGYGSKSRNQASASASLSLLIALGIGILLIILLYPLLSWLAALLGADGEVQQLAVIYMRIRLFGAPAVLLLLAAFGTLRGLQDMRTPLWIALGLNALNLGLDWLLIFGWSSFPGMGVAGSALASTISQWVGALAVVIILNRQLGLVMPRRMQDAFKMLRVGGDLFVRTALVNLFLVASTRAANQIGAEAGAAHQVIRQVYVFTSLALDAYAMTVQSLVGYFLGANAVGWMKKVVRISMNWSLGTGILIGLAMWLGCFAACAGDIGEPVHSGLGGFLIEPAS